MHEAVYWKPTRNSADVVQTMTSSAKKKDTENKPETYREKEKYHIASSQEVLQYVTCAYIRLKIHSTVNSVYIFWDTWGATFFEEISRITSLKTKKY